MFQSELQNCRALCSQYRINTGAIQFFETVTDTANCSLPTFPVHVVNNQHTSGMLTCKKFFQALGNY